MANITAQVVIENIKQNKLTIIIEIWYGYFEPEFSYEWNVENGMETLRKAS